MIVITGGAGFIGSNLVRALNEQRGRRDLVVVDDLTDGRKIRNLADLDILDLIDRDAFLDALERDEGPGEKPEVIFHLGACSTTTEWDGRAMLRTNYDYSKALLAWAQAHAVPLIYASSASVYGNGSTFVEERRYEHPLNPYAYSKFLFDEAVRRSLPTRTAQIVGLRYFNVYGPGEAHKGEQASVAYKLHRQLESGESVRLFEGTGGYANGEQRRDFVWVGDAAAVNLWFWERPDRSGIFNVGTGRAQPFNDVARAVIAFHGRGRIEYIPLPEGLRAAYQSHTQADLSRLRQAGYRGEFLSVEQGVKRYLEALAGEAAKR